MSEFAEPATCRVYVNERGVSVPHGATALEAVRAFDAAFERQESDAIVAGTRRLTDSRGLPVDGDVAVYGGAIFRIVAVREPLPENASVLPSSELP